MKIGVCNTGSGNLRSVERALRAAGTDLGVEIEITADPDALARADKIVVPGQGAFGDCARALAGPLGEVLRTRMKAGVPYFGICLGMQVLFESSEEAPGRAGLGYFAGDVGKLRDVDPATGARLKIPHMGWNTAEPGAARSLLPEAATYFYFVHSYVVRPKDPSIVAATTTYGERFVSAVAKDNVFACQFHPEKSQRAGLALLEKFLRA